MALNRRVAIKTLPTVSADAMSRLAREARTMAALSHPNLATILGQESWRGTPILVCEYLHRGTLQQRLTRGPLATDEALTLCLTLLDALEYMHAQEVLHRDIKPSNIAFAKDGTPKLLDFGLAGLMERTQASTTHDGTSAAPAFGTTMAGTVAYLPPAAFRGEAPTVLFDLWALTVVLFESIAGRHPFAAGADTAENICRGRFVAAIDGDREVPETISAFLRGALSSSNHPCFESSTALREAVLAMRAASHS
jgi:serine/threonine protein kinase